MARRASGKAIKKDRNYTVEELARVVGVCRGTVRRWQKTGLPYLTDRRPALILGSDAIAFLDEHKQKPQTCALHQAFCFSCRAPRDPAFDEVEIIATTSAKGMMRALCARCSTVMHKRVSTAQLRDLRAILTVTIVQDHERLGDNPSPCPNDHFETTRQNRAKTPS